VSGSASVSASFAVADQMASRSESFDRIGPSRRDRNCETDSPPARRRIVMLMARSVIVSGIEPIPAKAAMANVGNSVGICWGPTQRSAGRLR
jgi:hypothetical protein